MDWSADALNSKEHMQYRIDELEKMVRYLGQKVGGLEAEVKRQDQEIQELKQLNRNDGK